MPMCRRNSKKPWSTKDRIELTRVWGELSERELRARFGRTSEAIKQFGVRILNLGRYDQGVQRLKTVADGQLGVDARLLRRLARECGVSMGYAATFPGNRRGGPRHRKIDADAAVWILRLRETRATTPLTYSIERGKWDQCLAYWLRRDGLHAKTRRGAAYFPKGLLAEVLERRKGPWTAVWRAVLAEGELPVARWFVALAAHDVAFLAPDDPAREWIDVAVSQKVMIVVRRVAAKVRPPVLAGVARTKSADGSKKSTRAA